MSGSIKPRARARASTNARASPKTSTRVRARAGTIGSGGWHVCLSVVVWFGDRDSSALWISSGEGTVEDQATDGCDDSLLGDKG